MADSMKKDKMRDSLKKLIPYPLRRFHLKLVIKLNVMKTGREHREALRKLKKKRRLNCVFFALYEEMWKYDGVYRLMTNHPRFNPVVLVCPAVNRGRENMLDKMEQCYTSFKQRGYNVIRSYDKEKDTYVDVRSLLKPDIIFYTTPYPGFIDDRYYITNFKDILTAYVPYFISSNKDYHLSCDLELYNLVWRRYAETELHRQQSIQYAKNKGINVVCSGYPGIEAYLSVKKQVKKDGRKCIIWAPHHSIDRNGIIYYSCFFTYCDSMVALAKKYSKEAVFVFKPHPMLKHKLYDRWGKEKTDSYYDQWRQMENTTVNEGSYESLFLESDAMIHDCASFLVEYLYVNKPVMRTLNGEDLNVMFNSFGLQCIDNHYKAYSINDVEQFIQNVINGVDPLMEQRTGFVENVLKPQGLPSQNIIDDILYSIDHQVLYSKKVHHRRKI